MQGFHTYIELAARLGVTVSREETVKLLDLHSRFKRPDIQDPEAYKAVDGRRCLIARCLVIV